MAWIESHDTLAEHPKSKRFAKDLGVSIPSVIGHLHLLWWWAMKYADDGDLSRFEPDEIADAAKWEGPENTFWDALVRAGFVDENGRIHDWDEYAGKLIERRQANAERMRRSRAVHVSNTSHTRAELPDPTGPDQTKPDPTVPESSGETSPATAESREVFEHYKSRIQPQARVSGCEKIRRRLKTFSVDELKQAIEKFSEAPWWMQHNGKRGSPWFFANDARIEQFLNLDVEHEQRRNGQAGDNRKPEPYSQRNHV